MYDEDHCADDDVAPAAFEPIKHQWHTDELASEVREILVALDAPTADAEVMNAFQRTIWRGRRFGVDGRGRVILACRCILESEDNADAFREPFVGAVLDVCGDEFAASGLKLVEAFDEIKLTRIWEDMRRLEYFYLSEAHSALNRIIRNKVRRLLTPPQPEPVKVPSKKEQAEASRKTLASANRKTVERNIELGRKLAALRDVTPRNRAFSHAVDQFDLRDRHEAAELIRVARLYGDRSDITAKVRNWRVLVGLSSTTLSDAARRKLEGRILAGENVTAKAVAAAGSPRKKRR
ncbi:hypothetical protein CQ14_03005 [Bradyrhizobium lablabi]|uniref:Uncharacterized protein n=1 Tax=Bradyrhizobium lablabi TaxID=722472 RepID=A0A0R3NAK1_9BRAD|nr:hypothetical protein [Bradyrhizobium lablabi]KRR26470.1 hypothetical protein CQ14_03005 [Bradyrhizobium lablabi]